MNECTFSTRRLVEFLTRRLENPEMPIPPDLAGHAKTCQACAQLLAEEGMARAFIAYYRNHHKTATITQAAERSPSAIKPGQIWRFFYGPEKTSDFCLITSDPFRGRKDLDLAVRIAPLFLSPNQLELAPSDIQLSSGESPLGIPTLIETWNERPILCEQLMEYKDQLDADLYRKVISLIRSTEHENLSSTVQIFRQQEIARGAIFSHLTFKRLMETDLAAEQLAEYEVENEVHGLKLLYLKLGQLIKTVIHPEPLAGLLLREDAPASIYAASESTNNRCIQNLYRKLTVMLEEEGELPFRVRRSEDDSLQLLHINRRNFMLTVKMVSGKSYEIASSHGKCLIKSDAKGLPDSEEITLIILEEK